MLKLSKEEKRNFNKLPLDKQKEYYNSFLSYEVFDIKVLCENVNKKVNNNQPIVKIHDSFVCFDYNDYSYFINFNRDNTDKISDIFRNKSNSSNCISITFDTFKNALSKKVLDIVMMGY